MKKIRIIALSAMVAGVFVSCQKDDVNQVQPESSLELSKSHIEALQKAGVNPIGATYQMVQHFDEKPYQVIATGNMNGVKDLLLDVSKLEEYALGSGEGDTRQYRTNNLISSRNRTIDILGYTGSCCALSGNMRTGLQWAVNNYNRINTTLNFRLTFGTNYQAADMVVYNNGGSGAGGQAEFPSGGRPGKFIQILDGTGRLSNNLNEHVIGHEMGHAVGFRHTDYARRKCDGSNEGTAGSIGAVHIPGTPTANRWGQSGLDSGSLMISCFDGSEDGEFSNADITALEFLY